MSGPAFVFLGTLGQSMSWAFETCWQKKLIIVLYKGNILKCCKVYFVDDKNAESPGLRIDQRCKREETYKNFRVVGVKGNI